MTNSVVATHPAPIILASSSPYRRELLTRLGLPFSYQTPAVDETPLPHETTLALALRLAELKARAIAQQNPGAWVIGSDQVADLFGAVLGKPGNFERALAQLQLMRGNSVQFHTALCVMRDGKHTTLSVPTTVQFRDLPDAILEAYLHTEQPYDCAGSAKVEGLGISLLESVQSDDPTALIGLPLIALSGLLRNAGFELPAKPLVHNQ